MNTGCPGLAGKGMPGALPEEATGGILIAVLGEEARGVRPQGGTRMGVATESLCV